MKDSVRVQRLRSWMSKEHLDAVILYSRDNTRYFTGFTGTDSTTLITQEEAFVFVDSRYTSQAEQQCSGFGIVDVTMTGLSALSDFLTRQNVKTAGIEDDQIPLALFRRYESLSNRTKFVPMKGGINSLRETKDEAELEAIRTAVRLTDDAFGHILTFLRPGITERAVALELEMTMRQNGATAVSFETIVASGARSALPHGVATDKEIKEGDCVVMDFGCVFDGYCSDMTRTVFVGRPDPELDHVYDVVLRAQLAAESVLSPEITGSAADDAARRMISDAGYGDRFGHSLGHGVGLAIHESPRLARTNPARLKPGNVVTVEPGIYLPGCGGVRIEDMAVILPDGAEVLTGSTKEKIVL